jgi:hypothetical protein
MHHRRSANDNDDDDEGHRWLTRMIFNLSPSREPESSSSKHFYPSLLYTATHVFNFINTVMYWAVLVPQGHANFPNGGTPGTGWLQPFSVANMYGITSLIASGEVMFLNTIKHHHVSASIIPILLGKP